MKRISSIFALLILLGASSQLSASTNVGATLSTDTQWDQSGSPYIIQSRVLVPPGVTLKIGPGVQVVFQGPATLEIGGDLKVAASAAAPAVFNMTDGGLQSALFIDGGEAFLTNIKVTDGVFLVQDATIRMDASEVTKGSGLYLKGTTVAHLKNNKFYGNATGVVLDGPVEADIQFNTLVQNTYGLYLKDFAKLVFLNNSIHDNDSEVVNNATKAKLGGNYWGTMSPTSVKNKIRGTVSISPMKDLKDILRSYLRSELPVITKSMSDQAEAEDRRADAAAKAALKAYRQKQSESDVLAMEAKMKTMTPPPTMTPTMPAPTNTPVPPMPTPTLAMSSELAAPPAMTASVSAAPAAAAQAAPVAPAAAPAVSAAPAAPEPVTSGIPAPPMLSPSAPEPPALGQMAANVTPAETPNAPVSIPTSQGATVPTATATFALGGNGMTSDDLASIVATAQAASTATTPSAPSEAVPAPPMPPDLTSAGSPNANIQAMVATAVPTVSSNTSSVAATFTDTPVNTSTDTPAITATFTMTPTYTFTTVYTNTYTDTPTVVVPTMTPLPSNSGSAVVPPPPPMTSAPMGGISAPAVGSAAPAASSASSAPALVATVSAPTGASAPLAAPAAPGASLTGAVPPPPDFGDNSANSNIQAPMVPVNNAAPAPLQSQTSAPAPKQDLDVDGMQAPPMDSGLDFAAPKK